MTLRSGWIHSSSFLLAVAWTVALPSVPAAQVGTVLSEQKISETAGGFGGILDSPDFFGCAVSSLGDLNGDGNKDLAVGALLGDTGAKGKVWILFLNANGTVASWQEISANVGGLGQVLDPGESFGVSVAALGDLDGDGITELAVGCHVDGDGGTAQGSVWILFLNSDGTVASKQKISETQGGFGGHLDPQDLFGRSVSSVGDLNHDGIPDLAVGAVGDDDGGRDQGAVWILFLNANGTVASWQKISETQGGFGTGLDLDDSLGVSMCSVGDIDGDGNEDLAVGAGGDDDGGAEQGAVYILFLNSNGTVASKQKISETTGGFGGDLDPDDLFGLSVGTLGDLDGDGNLDLAVGAVGDDDGDTDQGAVWILFLGPDGAVLSEQKISETAGGFGGVLDFNDNFGSAIDAVGDLNGDGKRDLAVGVEMDDDGGGGQGAIYVLFLDGPGSRRKTQLATAAPLGPTVSITPLQAAPGPPHAGRPSDVQEGSTASLVRANEPNLRFDVVRARFAPSAQTIVFDALRFLGGTLSRGGSGVNELSLVSSSEPRAGEPWTAWIDLAAHPTASASFLFVSDRTARATWLSSGGLPVVVASRQPILMSLVSSNGTTCVHSFVIPPELRGCQLSLQALLVDKRGSLLTNVLDVAIR